jgi:hypothetical protein
VGCTSLGSFSSRFTELVGEPPSVYRLREHSAVEAMPGCVARMRTRPSRQGGRTDKSAGADEGAQVSRIQEAALTPAE